MDWPNSACICRQTRSHSIADGCRHQAKQRAKAAAVTRGCGGCGTGCAPQAVYRICRTAKPARGRRCWRSKSLGRSGGRNSEAVFFYESELVNRLVTLPSGLHVNMQQRLFRRLRSCSEAARSLVPLQPRYGRPWRRGPP